MKTIREETIGKATVRLVEMSDGYGGLVIAKGISPTPIRGTDPDEVWSALLVQVCEGRPGFFGFDGAKARFLEIFPGGFSDERYLDHERNYKDGARRFLHEALPLSAAEHATADDCRQVMRAYSKTNLLSQFEQTRTRELLLSPNGPDFVRAAAALANGDVAGGLAKIEQLFAPHGQASWPATTFLPFFWAPETQMFLKPMVTVDFAGRVGHPFADIYGPKFNAEVYKSLLDLASRTETALADLNPADRIDIQSFIWIVGAYDEKDAQAVAAERSADNHL